MAPDEELRSAKSKPSADQASSSTGNKSKSSRRRSWHEQHHHLRDEVEVAESLVADAGGSKQVGSHGSDTPAKSKKGDGENHRGVSSGSRSPRRASCEQQQDVQVAEVTHRGSKRRQNQEGEGMASDVVASAWSSKRWRSESGVVLAGPPTPPSPLDRWDGGQPQVEIGVALLPSFESEKQFENSLDASFLDSTGAIGPAIVGKEKAGEGDSKNRKGNVSSSKAAVASKSRPMDVAESFQIDAIISEVSARIKNRVSRKKEVMVGSEQEKGPRKSDKGSVEAGMAQVLDHNVEDSGGSRSRKSGNRHRWDGEFGHKEKEQTNLHPSVHNAIEIRERDKRKEKGEESRDADLSRIEKEHVLEDLEPPATKGKNQDTNKRQTSSEERESQSSEWKIQEELRNIELEKELQNRIRRRKEESSERDRWKDDDRDRESRRLFDRREHRATEQRHKGKRGEHGQKIARETISMESGMKEMEISRRKGQENGSQVNCEESKILLEDKVRLGNRDERDMEGSSEHPTDQPREHSCGKSRSARRFDHYSADGLMSPYCEIRASPSSRMDGSSPIAEDRVLSMYTYQRSPSPAVFDGSRPLSRVKTGRSDWLEPTYSVSGSSGIQRHREGSLHIRDRVERCRWHTVAEEEVKSGDLGGSRRILDEGRDCSLSPYRSQDYHIPLPPLKPQLSRQEGFSRISAGRNAVDMRNVSNCEEVVLRDREPWRAAFQSGMTTFDMCASDELLPRDRVDRGRHSLQVNRPMCSPMVRVPSLAPLPPPPPFRPGIDNPSIFGPPGGASEEGSASREHGVLDRKLNIPHRRGEAAGTLGPGDAWRGVAISNWTSRNQGPGPGSTFPHYQPHHYGTHPPAMFPGMGRQFSGPPVFGPGGVGRTSMDMSFGGGRFIGPGNRLGDDETFHVQGRASGWHGLGEDDMWPPVLAQVEGREGQGLSNDEHRLGWDRTVGPMGGRPWERDRGAWDSRPRDGNIEFIPRAQIDPPYQGLSSGQGGSWGIPHEVKLGEGKFVDSPGLARGEQEEKCEEFSSKETSEAVLIAKPSEDDKSRKKATASMRTLLSKLDISAELAGPELYKQYISFVSASTAATRPNADVKEETEALVFLDDDCILEVDLEAEALLSQSWMLEKLLPPLPEGAFEDALCRYKKPEEENQIQKSAIGSFILPFNPLPVSCQHLVMQLGKQQPATVKADKLSIVTPSTALADVGTGTVDNITSKVDVDGANGTVISQKLSQSCDISVTPEEAISLIVTEYSIREAVDVKLEEKLHEDSLGYLDNQDLDSCLVEGKQEPCNMQEFVVNNKESMYRDSVVVHDPIVAEEVVTIDPDIHTYSNSHEHAITAVTQFESDCSEVCEPSTVHALVTLVEYSDTAKMGDSFQVEQIVNKEDEEQNVEEIASFCSGDANVLADSNGDINPLMDDHLIEDQQRVRESEEVGNESLECIADVQDQTCLGKHVGLKEAGICIEESVKELACFMFILKRNRIFIRIRTFQLTTWFHRRLDILTFKFPQFIRLQGILWIPC
ncbi:hypothetical protein O6H91_05G060400 [Diphasiastrum complanatum]|uniref:Uncharacterized protein n=1 Tax=Diphasiastrum complanatum TaxID=34168 RepID=A0ACC2DP06_DIPCM|nr:hypothetical protein O6H91_05G060400 [Diphasiastrum complanatum]